MMRISSGVANMLLLIVAAIWGASFGVQAAAMQGMGPFWFTGIRFLLAALVVAPFASREGGLSSISRYQALMSLGPGLALFVAITLQQVSLLGTTIGNAGFLTSLYVVVTPLIARVVFGRAVSGASWLAASIALVGIALLTGASGDFKWGDILVLLSSFAWAAQILILEGLAPKFGRPVTIAMIQFIVVGVLGCLLGSFVEPISFEMVISIWPHLLFCSVVSVGLGYTLQSIGQQATSSTAAAVLLSSEAVFAAVVGVSFFGERLTASGALGALLVTCAVIGIQVIPGKETATASGPKSV